MPITADARIAPSICPKLADVSFRAIEPLTASERLAWIPENLKPEFWISQLLRKPNCLKLRWKEKISSLADVLHQLRIEIFLSLAI